MQDREWRLIEDLPADFGERGGPMPVVTVRDRAGRVWRARRATFNDSGWLDAETNREVWPVQWAKEADDAGR